MLSKESNLAAGIKKGQDKNLEKLYFSIIERGKQHCNSDRTKEEQLVHQIVSRDIGERMILDYL